MLFKIILHLFVLIYFILLISKSLRMLFNLFVFAVSGTQLIMRERWNSECFFILEGENPQALRVRGGVGFAKPKVRACSGSVRGRLGEFLERFWGSSRGDLRAPREENGLAGLALDPARARSGSDEREVRDNQKLST